MLKLSTIEVPGWASVIPIVAVAIAAACAGPSGEESLLSDRPECPRHEGVYEPADSSGHWAPTKQVIAGSSLITTVPEYHDCQRLIDPDPNTDAKRKFGPLVAIFAIIHLEKLSDLPNYVPPGVSGAPFSSIRVLNPPISPLAVQPRTPFTGTEESVATILNYDEQYKPLQIPRGYSCLYVHHNSAGTAWEARLIQASTDADCKEPLDSTASGWDLNVEWQPDPNPPPVARWDWDPINHENYIGIECGAHGWCEVYNKGTVDHHPSPKYPGMGKGWYDEQFLAEETAQVGNPDGLEPGIAMGTAVPLGPIDQYDEGMFANWQPVARVTLSEDSKVYEKKVRYAKGKAPNGPTVVSLCMGSKLHCIGLKPAYLSTPNCENAGDEWWAMMQPLKGAPAYRCVIRRKMTPTGDYPLPPGVIRWRWKLKDEGMWIRCPGGCCEKT
jgi:hypothetical protein